MVGAGRKQTSTVKSIPCTRNFQALLEYFQVIVRNHLAIQRQSLYQVPFGGVQHIMVEIVHQYIFDPLLELPDMTLKNIAGCFPAPPCHFDQKLDGLRVGLFSMTSAQPAVNAFELITAVAPFGGSTVRRRIDQTCTQTILVKTGYFARCCNTT
ncbi:hypothetical protein ASE31_10495 [Acidovorax sp. Root217]|nr:hypothetical protein ASE31_10495 [Acidovorax sp. Root217]